MKEGIKKLLSSVVVFIVIGILGFLIFLLPVVLTGLSKVIPVSACWKYSGLIGLYGAALAFLFGLYQAIKILFNINKYKKEGVGNLRLIKFSTISISGLYIISMPFLYLMADKDDAPGLLLFGLIVFLISSVSAVFVSAFEKRYRYRQ